MCDQERGIPLEPQGARDVIGRNEWNRQTVPSPSGPTSPRLARLQAGGKYRKKAVAVHYLSPAEPSHGDRRWMYLSRAGAERKISAPCAPSALGSPSSGSGDGQRDAVRKLSSMTGPDATRASRLPRYPSGSEDQDSSLAKKLGISDSHSDGHITLGRTSLCSPPLQPGILKHSDHELRLPIDGELNNGFVGEGAGSVTPRTPTSPSPTSPFCSGSAGSGQGGGGEPRRKVSINVQDEVPKKLSTSSYGAASIHSHYPHHAKPTELHAEENGKASHVAENGIHKKKSFIDFFYNRIYPDRNLESSSWYLFCKKMRKKDEEAAAEAWEPPQWQAVCPFPFCPTYRQFARLLGLTLVVLLLWGSAFAVLGDMLAPGGSLFNLAALAIAAHFGGWLVSLTTLPALVGMLLTGIVYQNIGLYHVTPDFVEVVGVLRKIALVIILTRAGLDLDPPALKRLLWTVLRIGLGPWLIECVVLATMMYFLFDMPWMWGIMLGVTVAAVSPAVTVPCLFRLRGKGYGTAKGIPTLIIAISGIDDAASVAAFGILSSIMFSNDSLLYQICQGPLSIAMGLGFGFLWGVLAKYVPERNDPFVVPLRVLMLFGGGLIAVLGSESIGLGGAGPLAVVVAAFVSCYSWTQQGWEVDDNPVATTFEIFWMIFEPILFGLTGTQIKLDELDPHIVGYIIAALLTGFLLRILGTMGLSVRSRLNTKEKVFVSLSLMAKASVQAALCTLPLDLIREAADGEQPDKKFAELFLTTCVLCILITAPTIAILMTLLGPRMLTKTTADPENWRRHPRPSLRDITIIAEDDEDDDDVLGKLSRRSSRRRSSSAKGSVKDVKETSGNHATPAASAAPATRETSLTTTAVP